MKKAFVSLLLCLVLCMSLGLSASAAGLNYVNDTAGILYPEEIAGLEENARQISEYYGCGVYMLVVDDYTDYVNGSIEDFSEAIYKSYELGLGEGKNGIILSLSMSERDYDLCAYGDFAHYSFTDYGKDKLADEFLDNFRNDDWVGGFNDYIAFSAELLELAKNGEPLDTIVYDEVPEEPGWDAFEIVLILLVSTVVGLVCTIPARLKMRPVSRQRRADEYSYFSAANLSHKADQFLYHDIVRHRIVRETDNDDRPSGGRPGGTTINSGGFSHKSGKF